MLKRRNLQLDAEQKLESSTFDDGKAVLDADNKNNDAEDIESLSREELGRLVASRWTGEKNEQPSQELDVYLDKDQENRDETKETNEEYNGYDSESDGHEYDDEDDGVDQIDEFEGGDHDVSSSSHIPASDDELSFSDITSTSNPSWLEKIQKTVRSIFKAVNLFQTPIDKSDAGRVCKEYDESSAKLSKLQSRITSLTQKLKQDFGPEKEFHPFYGQCFEINQNNLTPWHLFEFVSSIVQSRLGCLALLSTPALCLDDKLKVHLQAPGPFFSLELQEKLEALKREPVEVHDEL